ncbi:MAG: hypothetical protein L0Y55_21630 [Anaerolineales bacterium]|nr:hypothetical protein [Anaerolineales bacterium]
MNSSPERQAELRARLRVPSNKIPSALQRLGEALWSEPDAQLTHAQCRAALPQFVDAELENEPVAQTFAAVKHHLDQCDSCSAEYADLLETALADERGAVLEPNAMPRPDLSFLPKPAPTRTLRVIVLEWTRHLLPTFAPGLERELAVIADTFFARVLPLKTYELRVGAVQAMGLGRSESSTTLEILAACYASTQLLLNEITRQDMDAWLEQGTITQNVETRASDTARQIGIPRETAARFARAYAEQITQDPSALEALLRN